MSIKLRHYLLRLFSCSYFQIDPVSQNDDWLAGFNYVSPTNITLDHQTRGFSPIDFACLPVWDVGSAILPHGRHASNAPFSAIEVFESLQSLVPLNAADGNFCGLFDVFGGPGIFTDQFVQLLLFSIVNNFAGLDGTPAKVIIRLINQHEPLRSKILNYLTTEVSTVSSRAMAEKLLEAAIEAGEAKTVHDLLVLGMVKPDDIVFLNSSPDKNPNRLTPVEMAAKLRHLDIVGLLLRFHADANKTYRDPRFDTEQGALEYAIGFWGNYSPIDIKLVKLLLNSGATVRGRLMCATIRWGDEALVEILMSRLSPSAHVDYVYELIVPAAGYLRNDVGLNVVRQVMRACRDMHNNECIDSNPDCLVQAMCNAARRNNRELIDLLLPHGGQEGLDMALTAAAQFGSHSLVRLLISHGARANGQACQINPELDSLGTTPLAEAIRRGDDELVALFAKKGAWDQIGEPECLGAAMHAIGESGSLVYLLRVLQLVPNPDPIALGLGLIPAIRTGHEEVVLRLLEAGADLNSSTGLECPLVAALRIKSQAITWAILESVIPTRIEWNEDVVRTAIAWGDLEIIEALFFTHNIVTRPSRKPPLSVAIKTGNRSLIDFMINLGAGLIFYTAQASQYIPHRLGPRNYWSPLSAAALVRDAETAKYLLDHGADPADEGAILNAITHDRMLLNDIVQRFRQRYPQRRTGFGGRVLIHALGTRDEAALDLCLRAGFDVNDMVINMDRTPLGFAIEKYHTCLEWIPKLLDAGGDVNRLTSKKGGLLQTALLDAIETRSLPLVELLISKGAHVQKEAKLGLKRSPLQKACEIGSHTIVDLLLRHNADVNEPPAACRGATALQLAAKAGSLRIAKKLLDLGAKIDAPGVRIGGRCAIEFAAEYGRLHMISFLCNAAGGKFAAGQYESANALAKENGHLACADLLTELSAKYRGVIDGGSR